MEASSPLIDAVLTELIWVIGGGALGLVVTLAAIVMMTGRRRVPPVLGAAGVGLVALAAIGGGLGGLYNPDVYTGALAAGLIHLLAAFAAFPMAGLLLLGTTVIAFRDEERHRGLPAVVAALVVVAIIGTLLEGSMGGNLRFGIVRAVIFTGLGLFTVLSTLSPADDALDGVSIAGVVFGLAVGVVESAERGMAASMGLAYTVGIVDPDKRGESIQKMLEHTAPGALGSTLAVAAGAAVGLATVGWVIRKRGLRAGDVTALFWVVLGPAVLWVGMPGVEALTAAAAAAP